MAYRIRLISTCVVGLALVGVGNTQSRLYSFRGQSDCDYFGTTVGRAGDVNGDGFHDLIVGAPGDGTNAHQAGMFQVLSGRDGSVLHSVYGATPLGGLGRFSVVGGADVDGDGLADLIGGAARGNDGEVYVVSGQSGSILYLISESTASYGVSTDIRGDLDGDGLADILVGSNGLLEGYSGADGSLLLSMTYPNPNAAGFGVASCFVGDVDGDGVVDFAAAASGNRLNGIIVGSVFVYSGSDQSLVYRIDGGANCDAFGSTLATVGDVNADGIPDLIIGAQQKICCRSGYVRVCSGIDGSTLHEFRAYDVGDDFSHGTGIGDVNADGFDDIAVSAPRVLMPSGGYGEVRIMSGMDGRLLASISAEFVDHFFGNSIAGLGDVNGDGHPDLAIGIPQGVTPAGANDNFGTAVVISGACFAVRPYCQGGVNSTAKRATMYSAGTTSLFDATYRLGATDLPPGIPGLFFFGDAQLQAPFGDGFRCVGGRTVRVPSFVHADPSGTLEHPIDLSAAPITAGSTWNFQLWYRDSGPAGFNFSDALEVTFCQ